MVYTGQRCLSPLQSRRLGTSHSSPSVALLYSPESQQWSEISSLSEVSFLTSFGKRQSVRAPNLGCRGTESPSWFYVSPKKSVWDLMHEQAHCCDEAANHQLPLAAAFWIIWIVSPEECSSLIQNLMQFHCSTHSVILSVTATQYTCSLNSIYCLLQWSSYYSHVHIQDHSPWLSGYTDAA